jgi:hypothetical protein
MNMPGDNAETGEELVTIRFLKDFDGHAAGDIVEVEARLVYGLTEWDAIEGPLPAIVETDAPAEDVG